ncbi:MAG: hypothetical protein IJ042_01960 [Butyricicoccus sp.]|nr:hypothetical protein [Butyricicoccus sp.]
MSNQKLTTLAHLSTAVSRTKGYIDEKDAVLAGQIADVVADIEGIVAVGGEANILEGIKVNNSTLKITDKIAELLIETGTENGTINVAGAAVAIKGLADLAYKSEITENEFSDSLKASFAAMATDADLEALTVRVTTAEGAIT